MRSGSYAAGFLAGAVASGYANHSPLIDGIGRFLARAESSVSELVADLPSDIRHAFERLVSRTEQPGFPVGDGHGGHSPDHVVIPQVAQEQPPDGFDLDLVTDMILRGEAPPPLWRKFVRALDFSPANDVVGPSALTDLRPLEQLTELRSLNLTGAHVNEIASLVPRHGDFDRLTVSRLQRG